MEATGGVSVEIAFVMMTGPVKTAAAPWRRLHAGEAMGICVTSEGFVSVECVYVGHRT